MAETSEERTQLTGRRKAAILVIAAGPDIAADIYKALEREEIEEITLEIASLGLVPSKQVTEVLGEFCNTLTPTSRLCSGGIEKAREILEKTLDASQADVIFQRVRSMIERRPFDFLKFIEPNYLLAFIQGEHPQVMALILAYLPFEQSAVILSALPPDLQREVAFRIGALDMVSPEIISEVEHVLERKIAIVLSQEFTVRGGTEALVEMLKRADYATEKNVLEGLDLQNQEMAEEVRNLLFTFDKMAVLDDKTIQEVLRQMDIKELAVALKNADDEVKNKIVRNISSDASGILQKEMEAVGEVDDERGKEAQRRIAAAVRQLGSEKEKLPSES
ncbi:MAG: flagellar motor switch protein FliG [bacterium]